MFALQGWRHFTAGEGGGSTTRGDWEDGEAAEGGSAGAVDGKPQGARMGKAGEMPHGGLVAFVRQDWLWICNLPNIWICIDIHLCIMYSFHGCHTVIIQNKCW